MHTIPRFQNAGRSFGLVAAALLLVLTACDDAGTLTDTLTDTADPPAPPIGVVGNARYAVSYQQTEHTFSTVWPEDLVAAVGKSVAESGNVEYLIDYEVTKETVSYDADGYMTSETVHLEGHDGTVMPDADYQAFADEMPYDVEHENPVVRSVLDGNQIVYYRKDGTVDDQVEIDPEDYRISPAEIDSLEAVASDSASVDTRIAASRQRMDAQGVSYQMISERFARMDAAVSDLGEVVRARQVIDLAVGQPVQITYLRQDGSIDMQIDRLFQWASGVPYLSHSVTYQYGEIEGRWNVVSRTETTRENVRVVFN
jgi:hypothetical protein